jgi:hypothetical protein
LLSIQEKRRRLLKRIDRFDKLSLKFLDVNGLDDDILLDDEEMEEGSDLSAEEEEEYRDDDPFGVIRRDPDDEESPAHTRLPLPSAIRRSAFRTLPRKLVNSELNLREMQARDALHQIRIALGHKAYLFRKNIRLATGTKQKTRAWKDVYSVETQVKHHARVYRLARKAMAVLGASEELLEKYKVLHNADLRATTALVDPHLPGQRNRNLAWFWSLDIDRDVMGNEWMEECERLFSNATCVIDTCAVYRVHWLRSDATYTRWKEEISMVKNEMKWTVQFFVTQAQIWLHRREMAVSPESSGKRCYAARQAAMWEEFATQALQKFRLYINT